MAEDSRLSTRCVHAGELDDAHGSPHTPLYNTTTFAFLAVTAEAGIPDLLTATDIALGKRGGRCADDGYCRRDDGRSHLHNHYIFQCVPRPVAGGTMVRGRYGRDNRT